MISEVKLLETKDWRTCREFGTTELATIIGRTCMPPLPIQLSTMVVLDVTHVELTYNQRLLVVLQIPEYKSEEKQEEWLTYTLPW